MRISELSEKYNVEKRKIDYWTVLGLIPYTDSTESTNNYREYGADAESAIKKILLLTEECGGLCKDDMIELKTRGVDACFNDLTAKEHAAALLGAIANKFSYFGTLFSYLEDAIREKEVV